MIKTAKVDSGRFRAWSRYRDWDGQTRQVTATGISRNAAVTALKVELIARSRVGGDDSLSADSPFSVLAAAWLEDLMLDVDRADSTKDIYERELRGLVLPFFQHFTVREVTVGRIERFLRQQRTKSYSRAKHSRMILNMVLGYAVRREIIPRNPVRETSQMKKPPHTPKAHAEQVDRRMGERADEAAIRGMTPTSLTNAELELDSLPLTKTPKPQPVRAWVRYGAVALKVSARAVAWTPRAVALEWESPSGQVERAWVWASAVEAAEASVQSRDECV